MSSVDVIAYPGQKTREEWLVEVSAGLDHAIRITASRHGIVIPHISYLISPIPPFFPVFRSMYAPSYLKTTMSL